jgi:hypothetical protein
MINQPIFINTYQKGSQENANLGIGKLVGVETYSKKGVAQLSRIAVKVSGNVVTGRVDYIVVSDDEDIIYAQDNDGEVYQSTDAGNTWNNISSGTAGNGNGLVWYEGFLFSFIGTIIEYWDGATWNPFETGLENVDHPTFVFPNDNSVYFGNDDKVGKIGFGTAPVFDPGGTSGVDYFFSADRLQLPSLYRVRSISFLNINYVALGTSSPVNDQVADVILWNPTLSTFETPLRLYSQAQQGENGVMQLINRNNLLYAVTGGSHSVFETNGTTFRLIADISLHSDIRQIGGAQAQIPVFIRPRSGAIDVLGNKLLTGVGTPGDIGDYPTGYGLFPVGVWSVAFTEDGEAVQCEYTISTGNVVGIARLEITAIKVLNSNKILVAWRDGNNTYGIDMISTNSFQTDIGTVFIESEMMEIGTPLEPAVIQTVQLNFPRLFLEGQVARINYRTAFNQNFTQLQTFTLGTDGPNTGQNSGYKNTTNPIGATKYVQFQIQMATNNTNIIWSPELRNVIVK